MFYLESFDKISDENIQTIILVALMLIYSQTMSSETRFEILTIKADREVDYQSTVFASHN